jgi:hypothetical protein
MKGFLIISAIVGIFFYNNSSGTVSSITEKGSCEKGGVYSKQFNCDYVYNKATYKVYYWKDVFKDNGNDNRFVGTAIGLSKCRDTAIYAHRAEMEYRKSNWNSWSNSDDNWSERSYICMLTKDGRDLEKHRY